MTDLMPSGAPQPRKTGFSGVQLALVVLIAVVVTVVAVVIVFRVYVFPTSFEPVTLSAKEEQRLDQKLRRLGWTRERSRTEDKDSGRLEPEPYSEFDADREVVLTEKELNALISGNPDLARRVVVDLADDLASAKLLIPIPGDFPIMAGRNLRVHAGLELRLTDERRPLVMIRGVSIMGVPIPNAWLGNLKNVDLVAESGDAGFWKAFADGVEDLQVRDGELYIKLRE